MIDGGFAADPALIGFTGCTAAARWSAGKLRGRAMSTDARVLFAAAMTVLALVGLVLASRAVDSGFYYFGLALFVLGVLSIFGLIARTYR
jgi:hypothetical protein